VKEKKPVQEKKVESEKKTEVKKEEDQAVIKTYKDLEDKATNMKVPKGKFTLWLMKKLGIKNKKDMTPEQVSEAMLKIDEEFGEKKKSDDKRETLLKKVFAVGKDKLALESEDLRNFVRESYSKGLSEMTAEEIDKVIKEIQEM
jgi:hypothetical protein